MKAYTEGKNVKNMKNFFANLNFSENIKNFKKSL